MGGWSGSSLKSADIVPSITNKNCGLPPLPIGISASPSLILTQNQEILICGGYNNEKTCLEMKQNNWEHHSSNLNEKRRLASAVSMPTGVFIFGGEESKTTWEWLPSGTKVWKNGGTIPGSGFREGCAVQTSKNEIALIGGEDTEKQILKFNIESKKWTNYGNVLKQDRKFHSCVLFDKQIIVSGGHVYPDYLSSTEIIDIQDLTTSKLSSNMVKSRSWHGLVVAHVQNKLSVLAIGGYNSNDKYLDSIEIWNPTTKTWTMSDMKLSEGKGSFGYASVPTHLVCS